jgi:hypothetical protein
MHLQAAASKWLEWEYCMHVLKSLLITMVAAGVLHACAGKPAHGPRRATKFGDWADDELVRMLCILLKMWPENGVNIPNTKIASALAALDPDGGRRGEDQIKNWRTNNFKV